MVVAAVMVLPSVPITIELMTSEVSNAEVKSVHPGGGIVSERISSVSIPAFSSISANISSRLNMNTKAYYGQEAYDKTGWYEIPDVLSDMVLPEIKELTPLEKKQLADRELAYYWAPIWFQDTALINVPAPETHDFDMAFPGDPDFYDGWKRDLITRFNYDGNWKGNDNWDHLWEFQGNLSACIYYSVLETTTHWFIGYYDFHPRDWVPIEYIGIVDSIESWFSNRCHENDFEGAWLIVQKTGGKGTLVQMDTQAHNQYHSYSYSIDIDDRKGEPLKQGLYEPFGGNPTHPLVWVEAGGHGCYGRRGDRIYGTGPWLEGFPETRGVKYVPSRISELPSNAGGTEGGAIFGYELISIDGLWDMRFDFSENAPFYEYGVFKGNDPDPGDSDRANAPWKQDEKPSFWHTEADGLTFEGDSFYNPAHFAAIRTNVNKVSTPYSFKYIYNPYAIELVLESFIVYADRDWDDLGWDDGELVTVDDNSDPYFNIYMCDSGGNFFWEPDNVQYGLHLPPELNPYDDGVMDCDSGILVSKVWENVPENVRVFPENFRFPLYGVRYPEMPYFGIRAKERDLGVDQWLMSTHVTKWYGPGWPHGDEVSMSYPDTYWGGHDDGVLNFKDLKEGIMYTLSWDEASANIRVYGDVPDDDTTPPRFIDPMVKPSFLDPSGNDYLHFSIGIYDQSGVSLGGSDAVKFSYRDPSDTRWITVKPTEYRTDGENIIRAYFKMDPDEWRHYAGQTIQYKWKATDLDIDNPYDQLSSTWCGAGPSIESDPPLGFGPSLDGDTVVFVTYESDGAGPVDDSSSTDLPVIRYMRHGITYDTSLSGWAPDVSGDKIAYFGYHHGYYAIMCLDIETDDLIGLIPPSDLDLYAPLRISGSSIFAPARHYNSETGEWEYGIVTTHATSSGFNPASFYFWNCGGRVGTLDIYHGMTAFTRFDGVVEDENGNSVSVYKIMYIDGDRMFDTGQCGMDPSVDNGIIAFWTTAVAVVADMNGDHITYVKHDVIRYFDTLTGAVTETGQMGHGPSISYPLIAFTSPNDASATVEPGTILVYDMITGETISTGKLGFHVSLSDDLITSEINEGYAGRLNSDDDLLDNVVRCMLIPMESEAATPAGQDVQVSLYDIRSHMKVVLMYPDVQSPGISRISPGRSSFLFAPWSGTIESEAIHMATISTDAVYTGQVGIRVYYDPAKAANEGRLRMAQLDTSNGLWRDITVRVDPDSNMIIGWVSSLPAVIEVAELVGVAVPKLIGWGTHPTVSTDIIAYLAADPMLVSTLESYVFSDGSTVRSHIGADKIVCAEGTVAVFQVWIPTGKPHRGYYELIWIDNVTGETGIIGPGECPSVDFGIVAFHLVEYTGTSGIAEICYNDIATNTTVHTGIRGLAPSINYPFIAFTTPECWVSEDLDGDGILEGHCVLRCLDIRTGAVVNTGIPFETPTPSDYAGLARHYCMGDGIIAYSMEEMGVHLDWNGDGDTLDNVMCYYVLAPRGTAHIGILGQNPSVSGIRIAFDCWEYTVRKDLNHDGDRYDCVIMYYDVETHELVSTGLDGTEPAICGNVIAYSRSENNATGDLNNDGDLNDVGVMYTMLYDPTEARPWDLLGGGFSSPVSPGIPCTLGNIPHTVSVHLDPESLDEAAILNLRPISPEEYDPFLMSNADHIVSEGVFEFSLDGVNLTDSVEITMVYNESRVDETHPEQIVAYSSSICGVWEAMPIMGIDTVRNTVSFSTLHFSLYVLLRDVARPPPRLSIGENGNVSGHVYLDRYNPGEWGIRDSEESGVGNWLVTLEGWTTSGDYTRLVRFTDNVHDVGLFEFPDVESGGYWLNQTLLSGFYATTPLSIPVCIGIGLQFPTEIVYDFGVLVPSPDPQVPFVLEKGWNLWSTPVGVDGLTAKSLLAAIGPNARAVSRLDEAQGKYVSYVTGYSDSYDFPIVLGEGYFIWVKDTTYFTLKGMVPSSPSTELVKGWNLVGYSGLKPMMASELLTGVQNASAIAVSYLDSVTGKYHSFVSGYTADFDFLVTPGRAYFVYSSANGTLSFG